MNYVKRFRMAPGSKVKLKDIDPGFKDHHKRKRQRRLSNTRRSCANCKNCSTPMDGAPS